jgi:hypothetical protein
MLRTSALRFDVTSEKGLAILLDRTVQLGPSGCAQLMESVWTGPIATQPEVQRFATLADAVQTKFWAHRVETLLRSNDLSFDRRFNDIAAVAGQI